MKLSEEQQRHIEYVRNRIAKKTVHYASLNWDNDEILSLLDIIATLQAPDAAPAPTDKGFQWSETRKCWIPYSVWIGDKETPLAGEGGDK